MNDSEVVKEDLNTIEAMAIVCLTRRESISLIKRKMSRVRKYIDTLENFYKENSRGKPLDNFITFEESD